MKVLPKGTEITCPSCHKILMRSNVDIQSGQILKTDYFDPVEHAPTKHTKMECPFDGTPYGQASFGVMKVHTKDGWK